MLYLLAFLLPRAVGAEGRNDTVVHGWVDEPDGRGTWSILWSCLATIFICTWSVLHLDVPTKHGVWYSFHRKVRWVLLVLLAPELMVCIAFDKFFTARFLLKGLLKYAGSEWIITHTHFICVEGFYAPALGW